MGRRIIAVVATILVGAGAAWAQSPAPRNSSDSPYTDTVYTSDQHMARCHLHTPEGASRLSASLEHHRTAMSVGRTLPTEPR